MLLPTLDAFARALLGGTMLALAPVAALAQGDPSGSPAAPPNAAAEAQPAPPGEAAKGLFERDTLFGDIGGLRPALADLGVSLGLQEQSEVLGNATGGVRRQADYEGTSELSLGVDLGKLAGLDGGVFNVSAWQIHGRGLSLNALDNNLNTVSSNEALRGTLLFELWYEQALLGDKLAIRVGQLSADEEFQISQYASLFINHTFGWATQPSTDLPSGGPAYPLATPGIRLRVRPDTATALLLGVFNGNPAGPGSDNAQLRDASGTDFRLRDGVFVIGEAQYAINSDKDAAGLPGTYRFGAWYNSDAFTDVGSTVSFPLSASGASNSGTTVAGRSRRNDYGIYAIADQLVWRPADAKDTGVGVFARAMGSPGDRNLVNFYTDAGVSYKGPFPNRESDTVGLAFGYARISDTAAKLDSEIALATHNPNYPIRRNETVLEITYQYQVAPWWQVQPDAQYLFNLNGGVPSPTNPAKRLGDAAVFGVRTQITF